MKGASLRILIVAALAIAFAATNSVVLWMYIDTSKHYPEMISVTGRLRASLQRCVKLESNGIRNDELIRTIDGLFTQLSAEEKVLRSRGASVERHLEEMRSAWTRIKDAVTVYRASPADATRKALIDESEQYLDAARGLSFEAVAVAENSRGVLIGIIVLMLFNAAVLSLIVWWLKVSVTDRLEYSATHDHLTGIYNRRVFEQFLENELRICERQHREGYRSSLVLFDIDHFKNVNDTEGHAAGDKLLRDIASTVRAHVRRADILGRLGGDEFVIITSGSDGKRALSLSEKLRSFIHEIPIGHGRIDISIGVTELTPEDTPELVLARADKALYAAKEDGRGRTVRI